MNSSKKNILFLLLIFIASVLIRLPTINRPLSKHHEFCTAVALRVIQIWDEAGIGTTRFNPIMTYADPSNRFINNHASGSGKMMDESGNYFYVSHPPFAYYMPFVIFKIFGIQPDVLPIQIFNLIIHLLSGVGIFLILNLIVPSPNSLAAVSGYAAYMFSPGTLWFHSNVYMSDTLVQLFFIYGVFLAIKSSEERSNKWLILTGIACVLMTYTSWLGVFFCATLCLLHILKRDFRKIFIIIFCATGALMLTAIQYSQIAGWDALWQEWLARLSERSGWIAWSVLSGQAVILKNYLTSYLPLIIGITALWIFNAAPFYSSVKNFRLFAQLSILPAIQLHLVLVNYSGHDFTTLYGGLFLSVIFGIAVHFALRRMKIHWIIAGATVVFCVCITQFYYINRPGEYSQKGDRYADFRDIGKSITEQASDNEVVFVIGMKPSPEIVFYAGRNIKQIREETEASAFLNQFKQNEGVIFQMKENNKIELLKNIRR